jgi:hypothetical protein
MFRLMFIYHLLYCRLLWKQLEVLVQIQLLPEHRKCGSMLQHQSVKPFHSEFCAELLF